MRTKGLIGGLLTLIMITGGALAGGSAAQATVVPIVMSQGFSTLSGCLAEQRQWQKEGWQIVLTCRVIYDGRYHFSAS